MAKGCGLEALGSLEGGQRDQVSRWLRLWQCGDGPEGWKGVVDGGCDPCSKPKRFPEAGGLLRT